MRLHRTNLIPALLTTFLLCACGSDPEPRYSDPYEPLSGSRYIAFARSLATAVTDGHCDLFERSVDTRAMLTTAFAEHDLSSDDIDEVARVVPYGFALGDTLCRATADGGSYQAIMLHEREERPAVLFRLIQANGGLTYHDVIFGGTSRSGPRIVDVFTYGTGEYLTETMGRMLTTRGSTVASRLADRFVGRRATASPMRVALDSMRALVAAGAPQLALRYFAELPEEVRADKLLLLERLGIARDVGEREAEAAVREMRRHHPDDVSLNLALIDYHFLRNELDSTLAVIERLDRAVDRDPYLAYMRASIYRLRDDTVNMRHWAERAIHGDRSLHYPYWMLLDLSLVRGDHRLTFKLLRWLERFARYDVDDLDVAGDPRYRRFLGSKEYDEWIEWRAWWKRKLERMEPRNGERDVPLVPEDEEEESVPRPLT